MKPYSNFSSTYASCSCFVLALCLGLLSASQRVAQAQYTLLPTSDYLNVYFNDGSGTVYGANPTLFTTGGQGTPLATYSWLNSSTTPGPVPSGSFNTGLMATPNALAQVTYQQASLFVGSNSVNQPFASPVGTSLELTNIGSGIAELRIDWVAQYSYSGPNGALVPDAMLIGMAGTVSNYTVLAGEENFQVNANPIVNASIPIGGDFVAPNNYPYPGSINPAASWWGYTAPTASFNSSPDAFGSTQLINNGQTLTVTGFIDVLVDPGSVNVVIEAPEPSALALSLIGFGLILGRRKGKFALLRK